MKVEVKENKINFIGKDDKENIYLKIAYVTDDNRIYKVIYASEKDEMSYNNSALFAFNKTNGFFDKTVDIFKQDSLEQWNNLSFINSTVFYGEVLNIIKRRFTLGYIIKNYKSQNNKLSFNDYYIADDIHKGNLAKLISKNKRINFTSSDVASLIEGICKISKIPSTFKDDLITTMEKTFYDNEIQENKKTKLINNLVEQELLKNIPELISKDIWTAVLEKMNTEKSVIEKYYSQFANRQK